MLKVRTTSKFQNDENERCISIKKLQKYPLNHIRLLEFALATTQLQRSLNSKYGSNGPTATLPNPTFEPLDTNLIKQNLNSLISYANLVEFVGQLH
jgi:hypothetical protein